MSTDGAEPFDIAKAIEAVPAAASTSQPFTRKDSPSGLTWEWDGRAGVIQTGPLSERPKTWDQFILDAGLDPEEVDVIEPVQVRGWDSPVGKGNVTRMHYYRLTVRRRTLKVTLDELVQAARTERVALEGELGAVAEDQAFLVALGDLQLGKVDGDGVEGTVRRFLESTERAVQRYRVLTGGDAATPIYLVHLGDCIEGFQSQGGANTYRTTLTTTEQVRLYRRLLIEQIKTFSAVTSRLVVIGVPGNHDEAHRPLQTYTDSWAIDSVAAVQDALNLAGGYDHVSLHSPARDELTLTLAMGGTNVGMAHGHQWRKGQATTWWANQSHGRQPIGDADLLLSAHLHHLRVEESGCKTWIQVPALESESTWWRHRTGQVSRPGIVTMMVGGGGWTSLEIL